MTDLIHSIVTRTVIDAAAKGIQTRRPGCIQTDMDKYRLDADAALSASLPALLESLAVQFDLAAKFPGVSIGEGLIIMGAAHAVRAIKNKVEGKPV